MSDIFATKEAAAGQNVPDYAKEEIARLEREHAALFQSLDAEVAAGESLAASVSICETEDQQSDLASVIKRLRDLNGKLEAVRIAEKEPYLRKGVAVDTVFGRAKALLYKQNKNDKPGLADRLQALVDDYMNRKAREERRRREEAERIAREAERKAREEAEAREREAREAELRADRARKAENEAKNRKESEAAAAEAKRLRDEQEMARQRAQEATAAATARTADMVRTRTESGHMVTARQEPYVEIVDSMELDAKLLWPFVREDAKLAAL
ncbi:MAG: hypothetical protein KGL39_50280, partial [Patescibacteria group bacterium]|nr:hypothetical protein [Patescibacteria group bacterium]